MATPGCGVAPEVDRGRFPLSSSSRRNKRSPEGLFTRVRVEGVFSEVHLKK